MFKCQLTALPEGLDLISGTHGGIQPPVNLVPGDPTTSSGLLGDCMNVVHKQTYI